LERNLFSSILLVLMKTLDLQAKYKLQIKGE